MRKLSDDEVIEALEALIENERNRTRGTDRRDNVFYLALVQTVGRIKTVNPEKVTEVLAQLGGAIQALERAREERPAGVGFYPDARTFDVAMKTRAYWPMISEALRKFGFRCAARAGSVGANDPQDCDWPSCGCDPYAIAVLDRYIKQTGTEIEPGVESVHVNPPKEKTR